MNPIQARPQGYEARQDWENLLLSGALTILVDRSSLCANMRL